MPRRGPLRGSESEGSEGSGIEEDVDQDGSSGSQVRYQVSLQPPRLTMDPLQQEFSDIVNRAEEEAERIRAMQRQHDAAMQAHNAAMTVNPAANPVSAPRVAPPDPLELAKLQAATCLDLRKEIGGVERFTGESGALNHFIRSMDSISARITVRLGGHRLDQIDAESLQRSMARRIHKSILNRIQADESTDWDELRRRLQKEFGGGRWTPEEDALRMLRLSRRQGQSKGEFAAALLSHYQVVIDKYTEVMPGPEMRAHIKVIETLARAQLGEAIGKTVTGSLLEEANAVIDASGRGEEEREAAYSSRRGWSTAPRPRTRTENVRREEKKKGWDQRPRQEGRRVETRRTRERAPEERRCYTCGKTGHIQARCRDIKCYECRNTGHLARDCPYIRNRGRERRDEPMEVNHHRAETKKHQRAKDDKADSEEDETRTTDGTESGTTSEDDGASHTYALVCRQRGSAGRIGGAKK